jgi:hypothetical protein
MEKDASQYVNFWISQEFIGMTVIHYASPRERSSSPVASP